MMTKAATKLDEQRHFVVKARLLTATNWFFVCRQADDIGENGWHKEAIFYRPVQEHLPA